MKIIRVDHPTIHAARRVRWTSTRLLIITTGLFALQIALILQSAGRS